MNWIGLEIPIVCNPTMRLRYINIEAANAEGNLMLGPSQHKARLMLQRDPYASGDGIMSQGPALDGFPEH